MQINRNSIVRNLIILGVFVCFNISIVGLTWGAEPPSNETVFSLNIKEKPLETVLKAISEQTGYVFLVSYALKSAPVTIAVSNIPLEDGLKRVLKSVGVTDHALVFDNRNRISIIIPEGAISSSNYQERYSETGIIQDQKRTDQNQVTPGGTEMVPVPPEDIFARHHEPGKYSMEVIPPPSNLKTHSQNEDSASIGKRIVPPPPESLLLRQHQEELTP